MPMLRKVVFATVILAMASVTVLACDRGTRPDDELFESADVVFAGTVLYVDRLTGQAIFHVGRWIKGGGGDDAAVSSSLCGYSFSEGYNYIVYAEKSDGKLIAGGRTGTRVIGQSPPVRMGTGVIGESPRWIPEPLMCGTFKARNRSYPSYTEIAAVTGICVSLSLGLGLLVMRIKRRFRK